MVASLLAPLPAAEAAPRGSGTASSGPRSQQADDTPAPTGTIDLPSLDGADRTGQSENTDTRLTDIANRVWHGQGPIPEGYSPGSTLVPVELFPAPGAENALEAYLNAAGADQLVRVGGMLTADVPASLLDAISQDARVGWVRPASVPFTEAITGEGVGATNADQWHTAGWTGAGVKVAVIDLGFIGYSSLLGTELPASVQTQNYCPSGLASGTNHGTAVAEIVHEVAPDAALYLICIDTLGDLSLAVNYAIANGVTIISHSVGWFNTGRGDGTGALQTIVDNARTNGILWVNSAGNYAKEHWSGTFLDSDADGWHEFAVAPDESNTVLVAPSDTLSVFLKWDDWPTSSVDYDLSLYDDSPTPVLLASSTNFQTGTQPPEEALSWQNTGGSIATVHVSVSKFGSPPSTPSMDLFVVGGSDIEYQVAAGSLGDPATSPVVVAAGAVDVTTNLIEAFSSQGPTIDARTKPDVAAPDRVSGATYGPGGFGGTSAAAPHVAGLAALLSEAKPGITPVGLATLLGGHAVDGGVPGPDNVYGAGFLELATPPGPDGLGLVDMGTADWHLRGGDGDPTVFTYGTAGYVPFIGDWDGDGIATPGMYRQSDGFALLRNSNTAGTPDITPYFLAAPGDTIPIAGDWDGDGDDTVSWYQPSTGTFNIINDQSSTIVSSFVFGATGSAPFAGDFNGNGSDTIGVHNGTTLSFRNDLSAGTADIEFTYGQSSDLVVAGDWDGDGSDTFAVYRPSTLEVFVHNTNAAGSPDATYTWGNAAWVPVAGYFGPLSSGVTVTWDGSSATAPIGVEYAVESLYLEFPVAPMLPSGLRTNLAGLPSGPKTTSLTGAIYTGAQAFGGWVSVVTTGADTILLASDDGVDWRVAGAHISSESKARWFGGSPRFIGVIGADNTDKFANPSVGTPLLNHADSLHIISLVPEDGAGAIVGIPRDTIFRVPYVSGWTAAELQALVPGTLTQARADEINAHCNGQCDRINRTMLDKGGGLPDGPATTVTALELETGLDLEGYVHTGFGIGGGPPGFSGLVDAFISAFSTVFSFTAPYNVGAAVVEGQATVDGGEALAFGRERQTRPRGDYDRSLAQGLLMKAAIANVQPLHLQSTPGLLAIMDDYVNTDLTVDQILTFAASLFVVDTGPMPSLRGFHLDILGSMAYNRNEGTIPNTVAIGCSNPVFFSDGGFASWFTTQNWATFADLADGTLASTPWECLSTSGTAAGAVWDAAPLGMLRVTTSPALPSQILIDGLPADSWGLNWLQIPRGTYTVSFRDLEGYTTPAPQTVVVTEGATTPVVGDFGAGQRGSLRVTTSTSPDVGAVPATISVDGVPRNDWGMWTDLPAGDYQVCFGEVADYTTPACQNPTVTAGGTTVIDGKYFSSPGAPAPSGFGMLRITTSPALPSQILVDGIPYDSWGLNWVKVPPGAYTVTFTDVTGYATPLPQTVTVKDGLTTTVVGAFTQWGELKVITSPATPATIFVDGNPHNDWGMWTDLPTGSYQVCFGNVTGLTTPACQNVTITAGSRTDVTGTYS